MDLLINISNKILRLKRKTFSITTSVITTIFAKAEMFTEYNFKTEKKNHLHCCRMCSNHHNIGSRSSERDDSSP